jgi:hypothetical protein
LGVDEQLNEVGPDILPPGDGTITAELTVYGRPRFDRVAHCDLR